jgi:hypothetical protein
MNTTTQTVTPVNAPATADIVHYSSVLTQYISMPPDIFVGDDNGMTISELLWVIERDEDQDESLSVTLDCINKELRLLERNGESFTTASLYWMLGFAQQHDIKVTRMHSSFKDDDAVTETPAPQQSSQLH